MTAPADCEFSTRLAEFTERYPWVIIRSPAQNGTPQWRASWLTPPERGGAEEVKDLDPKRLLDELKARFHRGV